MTPETERKLSGAINKDIQARGKAASDAAIQVKSQMQFRQEFKDHCKKKILPILERARDLLLDKNYPALAEWIDEDWGLEFRFTKDPKHQPNKIGDMGLCLLCDNKNQVLVTITYSPGSRAVGESMKLEEVTAERIEAHLVNLFEQSVAQKP